MVHQNAARINEIAPGLFDEVAAVVASELQLKHSYRTKTACAELCAPPGTYARLARRMFVAIRDAFEARLPYASVSKQNWRFELKKALDRTGKINESTEVVLERCFAAHADPLTWANQVPIASGLVPGRRAVDLVYRRSPTAYDFIELKTSSNTPLHAAVEIIEYGLVWLLARPYRGKHCFIEAPLLAANDVRLCVLAPPSRYADFDLKALQSGFDMGLRGIGAGQGVRLGFRLESFDLDCSAGKQIRAYSGKAVAAAIGKRLAKYP